MEGSTTEHLRAWSLRKGEGNHGGNALQYYAGKTLTNFINNRITINGKKCGSEF